MKGIHVYFSCGLTGVTDEYKQGAFLLREEIRKIPGVTILDFCEPGIGEIQSSLDDEHVYINDIHACVAKADAIVADVSLASFGVGYELGVGIEKYKIPTFMCKKIDVRISKIAMGTSIHNDYVTMGHYHESLIELLPNVKLFLEKVIQQKDQ